VPLMETAPACCNAPLSSKRDTVVFGKAMTSAIASIARVQRFKARRLRALILDMLGMPVLLAGLACGAAASENVPFEVLGGDQCYMFSQLVTTPAVGNNIVEMPLELVIDNEKDYKKLFDPQIMRQSCVNVDPSKRVPDVDFSKKTVLGLWSEGSCAATGFEKKVLRDDIQKTITYSVTVLESQLSCSGPGLESLNLIAIPKLPAGYKVFFESLRKD
jgi:hypothetical protein